MELIYCPQILLSAAYLLGTQNMIADSLGRSLVTDHAWELHDTIVSDNGVSSANGGL